jgi:hypothetical protein
MAFRYEYFDLANRYILKREAIPIADTPQSNPRNPPAERTRERSLKVRLDHSR